MGPALTLAADEVQCPHGVLSQIQLYPQVVVKFARFSFILKL